MKRLTVDQVKRLHTFLIAETGGLDGIRDEGLLESAVNSPFHTFDNEPLYKTIEAKAARLCYSLINNHAFIDGNKRTGMMAMLLFLDINGMPNEWPDEEIIRIGTELADGRMDSKALLDWIIENNAI